MESSSWTTAAHNYSSDVLSVFESDSKGRIRSLIAKYASSKRTALDLGCGPGKFLPLLSNHFGKVIASDYSKEMLQVARRQTRATNIQFERCDLRKQSPKNSPADFVLCINTLLDPDLSSREQMWQHLSKSIKQGGTAVLVLPSLESGLLSRHRLVEWNLRSGIPAESALSESFDEKIPSSISTSRGGVLDAGGILTKHYLREEIACMCKSLKLTLKSCRKITYSWETEFSNPPEWMKSPYPWDWLVVIAKR